MQYILQRLGCSILERPQIHERLVKMYITLFALQLQFLIQFHFEELGSHLWSSEQYSWS